MVKIHYGKMEYSSTICAGIFLCFQYDPSASLAKNFRIPQIFLVPHLTTCLVFFRMVYVALFCVAVRAQPLRFMLTLRMTTSHFHCVP